MKVLASVNQGQLLTMPLASLVAQHSGAGTQPDALVILTSARKEIEGLLTHSALCSARSIHANIL